MTVNRRAVVFGAIAVVAVLALWWVFIFAPKGHDLNNAKDDLATAQHDAQTLQAQLNQLKDLHDRSPQIEAQLGKLSAAIPEQPDQASFISGLNDIADSSGITWQSVTMQTPTTTPGAPETLGVQIQIQGGFFQVLDYFNRLEDLDRLVVVDSVNVTSGGGSGSSTKSSGGTTVTTGGTSRNAALTATLNARIFSQGETGATSGSTATTVPNGSSATTSSTGVSS